MRAIIMTLSAVATLAGLSSQAQAGTFTSRAAFAAATTGLTTINFNSVANGQENVTGTTFSAQGVTFAAARISNVGRNFGAFAAGNAYNSAYLEWQGAFPSVLSVALPALTTAVGFDFMELYAQATNFIVTVNGNAFSYNSTSSPSFFGYTSSTPITSLTISLPSAGSFYGTIDNVSFGSTAAVPEPASWAMMIGGLGLVGATLRRRSAKVSFA